MRGHRRRLSGRGRKSEAVNPWNLQSRPRLNRQAARSPGIAKIVRIEKEQAKALKPGERRGDASLQLVELLGQVEVLVLLAGPVQLNHLRPFRAQLRPKGEDLRAGRACGNCLLQSLRFRPGTGNTPRPDMKGRPGERRGRLSMNVPKLLPP